MYYILLLSMCTIHFLYAYRGGIKHILVEDFQVWTIMIQVYDMYGTERTQVPLGLSEMQPTGILGQAAIHFPGFFCVYHTKIHINCIC